MPIDSTAGCFPAEWTAFVRFADGTSCRGHFDRVYISTGGLAGNRAMLLLQESDLPEDFAIGSQLEVNFRQYRTVRIYPDGTGTVMLQLEETWSIGYSFYRVLAPTEILHALNLTTAWPDETVHFLDWIAGDLLMLPDRTEVQALLDGGLIERADPGLRPDGYLVFVTLVPIVDPETEPLNLLQAFYDEDEVYRVVAHYLDWRKGDLLLLPPYHAIEALISGGLVEPMR